MACYRCETVEPRGGDPVGVCRRCGALACRLDGERDADVFDFKCGMCVPERLTRDAGLPPSPPPRDGGGGPGTPAGPTTPEGGGGGGGAAVGYASTADFEARLPALA